MTALLLSFLLWGGFAMPAHTAPAHSVHVEASLLSEVSSIAPGRPFWVALRMKMDPKWHTYWSNPGDSGFATTLEWTLPEGFTTGPIQWPCPERIEISSLVSYGYEGEVYLLQEIRPPENLETDKNVTLAVKASWLGCEEFCIPGMANLQLALPVRDGGGKSDPMTAPAFAAAKEALPVVAPRFEVIATMTKGKLTLAAKGPMPTGKVYFFPETPGQVPPAGVQTLKATEKGFVLEMDLEPNADFSQAPLSGVLFVESGFGGQAKLTAIQLNLPLEKAASPALEWNWASLLGAIFSALLGGMILNLMPCVFPVLSIKVLGFVRQSESQPGEVRLQGLLFGAGVLASFLVLAAALLFLRAGGEQLGWGFQLQSPVTVGALVILFFAIALNLLGVFEIGTSLMGLGATAGNGHGRWGSFLSGVLATLVATPCTAPFMGSALGFALSQPTAGALLIFASLGIGMAAPYVLLSFVPSLGRYLPKPGAWMESFKQWMAFPLLGTVVWLLWVFGLQVDVGGMTNLLVTLLAVAMAAWIYGRWGNPSRTVAVQWTARIAALLLVFFGIGYTHQNLMDSEEAAQNGGEKADAHGLVWEPYSPERIEELRAEGRPIYLDFTAAWCATCQVNKQLVFGSDEVRTRLKELNVALVRGDWTRRDPVITKALESFDRAGVPLNVIYGKGPDAKPVILPGLLTPGIVLDALKGM